MSIGSWVRRLAGIGQYKKYAELRQQSDSVFGYGLGRRLTQLQKNVAVFMDSRSSKPVNVVDLGCYDGYMLKELVKQYPTQFSRAVGVDIFPDEIPETDSETNVEFIRVDLHKTFPYPFEDAATDLIVASAFFKHHPGPDNFLLECHRILSKGGSLIMLDPRPFVVQFGFLIGYFERNYNPNIWSRRSVTKLLQNTGLSDSFEISTYQRYWVAPNRTLFKLGIEKYLPAFIQNWIALHQSLVLTKTSSDRQQPESDSGHQAQRHA